MAKIQTAIVDAWPMMTPLGRREAAPLEAELADDEIVLGQAIATFGQTVAATERRVLVIKTGVRSGQIFGGTANEFPYDDIADVTITTRLAEGDFEIVPRHPTAPTTPSWANAALLDQPHGVTYSKLDAAAFALMASNIRELSALGR